MELTGTAAGVPYVALPPTEGPRADAPVIIAYHLLDAPRTERAFAAALPLAGLDAWKVYLGLPLSGARLPAGRADELWRLITEDAVLNVHRHVTLGALAELPAAYAAVRDRIGLADGVPVGVLGGSMGGAAAQLVLADGGLDVRAAVLVNPVVRLRDTIDGVAALHGMTYEWSPAADEVASRLDFVARAADLRKVPIRFVTGADDMVDPILAPVDQAVEALRKVGATVDRQVVAGMAHALAEEPGTDPAPQQPHAAVVDGLAVEWFGRYL